MPEKISFYPGFQTSLPLPLARLYTRSHHAKGDRERHDHAFHLVEATLKLAAAALVARYRSLGERSPKVDAALRHLARPSLGQWRTLFREILTFLAVGETPDPWAGKIVQQMGSDSEALRDAFSRIAKSAQYKGPAIAHPTALDLLDLLPTYRNAMSDAHGGVKADPEAYREPTPALLALVHAVLEDGAILGGGRLVYSEEVRIGLQGEGRVVWMDLTGLAAMRRQPFEGEATSEQILPARLYLEIPGGEHLVLDPLLHYQPGDILDQVFFLNKAREGAGGIQFLSYTTGEFYLPGRDPVGDALLSDLKDLLSWVTRWDVTSSRLDELATASRAEAQKTGEVVSEESEPTGTVLGDFEILGELGRGGMAVVYLARQMSLNRQVALKVLPPAFGNDPVALARFRQEVRGLSRCDHPNVVKILSSGEAQGTHYYAMEFIDGGDLAVIGKTLRDYKSSGVDVLREEHFDKAASSASSRPQGDRTAGLPTAEKLQPKPVEGLHEGRNIAFRLAAVIRDAARGVHHVHEHEIVHRDLKPQNIMVTRSEHRPVVMDLGLAKVSDVTRSLTLDKGSILGTLRYMPPEQLQRNLLEVDARADVYALGAVLYELACLRPMLDGDTEERLTAQILFEEPPPAQKVNPRIPSDLARIIAKATRKDPKERYTSAAELAEDLDRFVHGEAISAKPPTLRHLLGLFVRRHRAAVALAAALLVALVAGLVVSIILYYRVEGQRMRAEEALGDRYMALEQVRMESEARKRMLDEKKIQEGRRLLSESMRVLPENPGLALLLAIEGERRAPGLEANNALLAVLAEVREESTLRHGDTVAKAVFSPDGQRVLTASYDKTARIWNADSGQKIVTFNGHENWVGSAVFSPNGMHVVTASRDKTARIWGAASGRMLVTLKGHEDAVISAVFSPDGQQVLTASADKTARIWDAASGRMLVTLKGHEFADRSAVFSPDGQQVLTASADKTARIWDAASGKELATLKGHEDCVFSAVFSPDGQRVLTASEDKTARIWDPASEKELVRLKGHVSGVRSAVYSPNGQRVLTASDDRSARIWGAPASGGEFVRLKGHKGTLRSMIFSPEGQHVLTVSIDGTAQIWEAGSGKGLATLKSHEDGVLSGAFSPEGGRVLTICLSGTARIWDAISGEEIAALKVQGSNVGSAVFSPDAKLVLGVSIDGIPRIWDAASGIELVALEGHEFAVLSAVFSPDGRRVLTASRDKTARIWDAASGKMLVMLKGHDGTVVSAAYSFDGQSVLTVSLDMTVRIWDEASGKELTSLKGREDLVQSAVFSRDGQRVLTTATMVARIWDAISGNELFTLKYDELPFRSAVFSPDGLRILTESSPFFAPHIAQIWDPVSGKELVTLKINDESALCTVFSPDGQRLLTTYRNGRARAWPVDPLKAALRRKPRELTPGERDRYDIGTEEEREAYRAEWERTHLGIEEKAAPAKGE